MEEGDIQKESDVPTKEDLKLFWGSWKKWVDHFCAPLILLALVLLAIGLYDSNDLKKEILDSPICAYHDDAKKMTCYCSKDDVAEILAKIGPNTLNIPVITNASGGLEPFRFSFQNKTSIEN